MKLLVQELSSLHVKYADRTVDSVAVDDQVTTVSCHVQASVGAGAQRRHVQVASTLARRQLPECHGAVLGYRYQLVSSEQQINNNLSQ